MSLQTLAVEKIRHCARLMAKYESRKQQEDYELVKVELHKLLKKLREIKRVEAPDEILVLGYKDDFEPVFLMWTDDELTPDDLPL